MNRAFAAALVLLGGAGLVATAPLARASSYSVVYAFQGGTDAQYPYASLLYIDGTLYGTSALGGTSTNCPDDDGSHSCGTVFSLNLASSMERVLYSFQAGADGSGPFGGVIDVGGALYGTTVGGGDGSRKCGSSPPPAESGCGTIFRIGLSGDGYDVVQAFDYTDGAVPYANLIKVGELLYGTTAAGGAYEEGTVFSYNPKTEVEKLVYSFQGGSDGTTPLAGLIDVGGTVYGTTHFGGSSTACVEASINLGCGTVFSLNLATGTETVLHAFQGGDDGAEPQASLSDVGGVLYGTTVYGGGYPSKKCNEDGGCGTVFSYDLSSGTEKVVHSFRGKDGALPFAGLIDVHGRLYGTTAVGGSPGYGTVFSINVASGAEKVEHSFQGGSDGIAPDASLIDVGGTLYGTTTGGGGSSNCKASKDRVIGCGTVFAFTP